MINQMKAMGAIAGLLKNKEQLKEKAEEVKVKLETTRVFGESGGGAVRVTCTCRLIVERIEIAPALASSEDAAELERLVELGVCEAMGFAQERAKAIIAQAVDEMGLSDILGKGDLESIGGLLG